MKHIVVIKGKKYEWKSENVHPILLISLFLTGLGAAAVSFWAFCSVSIAVLG